MNRRERRASGKQGGGATKTAASPVQLLLGEALRQHQARQLDRAEQLYRRILADAPAHPAALANMGMLFHQRRALDEAEKWYAAALAVQRTPELLNNFAMLRRAQKDTAGAEQLLTEALALRPDFPDGLYNLGLTMIDAGRPGDAIAPLSKRARDPAAGPEVHANLARTLHAVGRTPEALPHGQQALLLKDRKACTDFQARGGRPLDSEPAPPFDPARPQHNVVAFSLWGSRRTYVEGAVANARLVRVFYPGWTCRIYVDDSVPHAALDALRQAGAQIVAMPQTNSHYGLFWRFFAADDEQVRYFLCRDADSRINSQEAAAVAEWLGSGRQFHVMRDAPFHTELILAGLWGGVGGRLRGIRTWIDRHFRPTDHRWADQDFLRVEIWPRIREQAMIHDGFYSLFSARPFPTAGRLTAPDHVGAGHVVLDESRREP
jgi:Flp pilus assembly protein TadD